MSELSVTDLLENMRADFLDDMPSRIDLIENEVMASQDESSYDELFRMVHSLKGSAGSYNLHEITKVAHSMEDAMFSLMKRNEFHLSTMPVILLKYIDILRETT